jgi:hypothetical protein
MKPIVAVARFALLEAWRSGLPWLALACVAASLALAGFLSQVALTESRELQASAAAALLRLAAVFLVAAHVVAAVAREAADKGLELALALPVSRPAYYLGKLAGFCGCGVLLAAVFAVPMLLWSPPAAITAWGISLAAETTLVAAAALFFAMTLVQVAPAIAATAGLYLLGRSVGAIQAIAAGPLAGEDALAHAARWTIDALALVLPRLDRATRSDWLLYGPPGAGELLPVLAALAVYLVLLAAAGLFDFSRKNL